MTKSKLTNNHFCYILFLEMSPTEFLDLLKINTIIDNMIFLDEKDNLELYQEAKQLLLKKDFSYVSFDFDYDSEPFVFNKYINGKLDRAYKICIFEMKEEKDYIGETSKLYCDGMPIFFDPEGQIIKNYLN